MDSPNLIGTFRMTIDTSGSNSIIWYCHANQPNYIIKYICKKITKLQTVS